MSDLVEFRHLKYIVAVAETANFTRAAERLFVAQPSLSRQIRDIEEALGILIFERTREGVRITPAGQIIVDYAQDALSLRLRFINTAIEVHSGSIPPLRLGFSSFINPRHLQSFRALYNRLLPNCQIFPSGCDPVHILQRLERGDLDCAILPMPVVGPEWIVSLMTKTPLVVCMRSNDPLANLGQVDLKMLTARLSVFRDPDGHPSAHARLIQMFADAGIPMKVSCSAATPHDIQQLVRDGYGLALIGEDTLIEADLITRRINGVDWTADTAFVHHSRGSHAALSLLDRLLNRGLDEILRKTSTSVHSQLPLSFDVPA
jgi:DNA-binding transcriptional LysR family regulator